VDLGTGAEEVIVIEWLSNDPEVSSDHATIMTPCDTDAGQNAFNCVWT